MNDNLRSKRSNLLTKILAFAVIMVTFWSFTGRCSGTALYNKRITATDTIPIKLSADSGMVITMAEFPGGRQAWLMYLMKNLRYPPLAYAYNIEGQVIVKFIVDEKGKLKDLDAITGAPELRQEAIRVIKESGRWTPATKNGNAVKSEKEQMIIFKTM